MHLSRGLGRLLLLISLLTPLAASSSDVSGHSLARRAEEVVSEPPVKEGPPALTKTPKTGTKDAPVDGLDGKPHSGPLIPHDGPPAGSGAGVPPEVGVSGGVSSVDMTKPPPVTGEHEIVGLEGEEGVRKEDSKSDLDPESNLSKSITTDPSAKDNEEEDGHDHHEHKDKHDDDDEGRGPPVKFKDEETEDESGTIDSPWHSFTLSFIMILFSEIGDKTFLIAALMAMKHPRLVVFTAALASLIVMSVLSAVLGHAVPTLISRKYTSLLAGGLFLVFGARMIHEGLKMEKGTGGVQEEMKEVEQELQEKEAEIKGRHGGDLRSLEEGGRHRGSNSFHRSTSSPSLTDSEDDSFKPRRKGKKGGAGSLLEGIQNLAGLVLSPAWVQTFVMTFLGEWGDRSQIATIAMAAGQDYWWVTLGTITGHSICTAGAVIGGRFLAEKISVRNVTLGGACAFLVFGVIYLLEALYL